MKTIRHFTHNAHMPRILADGKLKLEGSNIEDAVKAGITADCGGMDLNALWRLHKKQFKHTGRYVWFTEADDISCIYSYQASNKIALEFDATEIGAVRWIDVASKKARRSTKARKIIKLLNDAARMKGDDITKWWVVENEVDLEHCTNLNALRLAA